MTDLTEQWKKGKLPSGYYYIRRGLRNSINIEYLGEAFFEGNVEVIDVVQTYKKWQAKLEEIKQLKKLLKECRDELDVAFGIGAENLVYEIDEVLEK